MDFEGKKTKLKTNKTSVFPFNLKSLEVDSNLRRGLEIQLHIEGRRSSRVI